MASESSEPSRSAREQASYSETRAVDARGRAERRLLEYFHTWGLTDAERVRALADELGALDPGITPGEAVARAQERLERWRRVVFGRDADVIEPLWLRAFAAAHPRAFLGPRDEALAAVAAFGDPREGRAATRVRFRDQAFQRAHVPRWLACLALPVSFAASITVVLAAQLARGGFTLLELVWTALFGVLLTLASLGLFAALYGFARDSRPRPPPVARPLPRTALLMPIYHEDPEHVFAALLAMRESLGEVEGGDTFELFVLSDSRSPERAAEEERAFRRVAALAGSRIPLYYRRRVRNERQKAGNLAEFFERWGHRYTYAVILDADSLMRGDTLVELVRRMEEEPELALLQAPLALHGGRTLFARAQQFATSVNGPILTRGLSRWSGPDGNYFGHNAVVRVRAFLECCALPVLAGKPPFGGHILSHDFVEAALLCRAGFRVRIAHDLAGSWEELPPTLPEYIARDRRWCQGNFQHLRILFSEGLRPMSRLHMLVGAAMYLASPLWLAFVVIGALIAHQQGGVGMSPPAATFLLGVTALALLGPRFLGLVATLRDEEARREHGGALRLVASVLAEGLFAALLSPVLMFHHTRIVLDLALGRSTSWGAQNRHAAGSFVRALRHEGATSLAGLGAALTLWAFAPALLVWLSPVWGPWLLAAPIAALASSEWAGRLARGLGLFATPPERAPDPLLTRAASLRALTAGDEVARFRDLVLDPVLLHAHLARLGRGDAEPSQAADAACQRALRVGPAALSDVERSLLAASPQSMRTLHREAWRTWPVESWQLGRELAQLPPDD